MTTSVQAASAAEGRTALLALRAAGRRDELIELGYRYLEVVDDDPEIALTVLRALVEAGLGGPARELLHDRRDLAAAAADLEGSLDSLPAGLIPWSELTTNLERNAIALMDGRPHLAGIDAALATALEDRELYRTRQGTLHLSRVVPGRVRAWVPSFHDPAHRTELPLDVSGPVPAVMGTGTSPLADRVWQATRPDDPSRPAAVPVFVVEDDLDRLAAWLYTTDRTDMLGDPRVLVFAGPDAPGQLERYLEDNEDIRPPEVFVTPTWARGLGEAVGDVTRRIAARRTETLRALTTRLAQRGAARSAADWADRLAPGATVIGVASRTTTMLQYSMRDIGQALEALGYRFRLLIEQADHRGQSTLTMSRAIDETDPALIVLINHFRFEQRETLGASPILTWLQDPTDLILSKETGASIAPLDFVCGYYQRRCTKEFGYPPQRFFPAPLPVSSRIFHDAPLDRDDTDVVCDAMYVGHLHDTADEHLERFGAAVPADMHPLLEAIRVEVTQRHARGEHLALREAGPLVSSIARTMNVTLTPAAREQLSGYFAFRLFDILFRRQTLLWAARWAERHGRSLRLYGRGWERDPELARFAAGPVEHGEALRRAYRGARLTIQTIPGGFGHQRAYEALLSGSLVVGRRIPPDFLETGSVRTFPALADVVFRDAAELADVAETYLADPDRRDRVRREFAEIVRREFCYEGVVAGLLDRIRGALSG